MRLGPGPVFACEWLTTTRRWQLYALRASFVGIILIGMLLVWRSTVRWANLGQASSIQVLASYGENLYRTVVSIELTLVLLAAPAATASAICLDKARGTLDHMLATDLSNAEIVLGKLGARLVPVLGLIACVVPIMALASLLGGIDPQAILGSFLTTIGCAFVGCSLAMILSVWGRKTHEVLMLTYLIIILWVMMPVILLMVWSSPPPPPLWEWLEFTNPYALAFAPYTQPGKVDVTTYLAFLTVCLGFSGLFVSVATLRIRSVALNQARQPGAGRRRWMPDLTRPAWLPIVPGPSLDNNPILWREWHRSRPTRFFRMIRTLYSGLGVLWIVLSIQLALRTTRSPDPQVAFMNAFQVMVGLLLLSVSATTSLAEERVRGSLDVLLTTPMDTRSILVGKWWGAFRQVRFLLIWPALATIVEAVESGHWLAYILLLGLITAYCASIVSLGLALATWVSRLGRAVALSVSAFVLFTIGWPVFVFLISGDAPERHVVAWVMGSPFYGLIFASVVITPGTPRLAGGDASHILVAAFFWTVINGGIAAILFKATVATFDYCLGRISETSGIPMLRPKPKPSLELDF